MTPYEVLGVREDASHDEIRRAYLALARRHHPDQASGGGADEQARAVRRMQEINEAWSALGDPARRTRVDRDLPPRPFRPFDDGADDPDPRLAPDVPYRQAPPDTALRRTATVAPVVLGAVAALLFIAALFFQTAVLFVVGVVAFALAGSGFLAIPLLALGRATRDE
jgi:hypothetical protein